MPRKPAAPTPDDPHADSTPPDDPTLSEDPLLDVPLDDITPPGPDPDLSDDEDFIADPADFADAESVAVQPGAVDFVAAAPRPASELSADERRIRDLEDQLARERGRKDPDPELETPTNPDAPGNILIHFVADGLTALGRVWYTGQELEFEPGSGAYRDTCDRYGQTWLDLRRDESAQIERYGAVMFREGPWPGKDYTAAMAFEKLKPLREGDQLTAPTAEQLAAARDAERHRRRAAPRLLNR